MSTLTHLSCRIFFNPTRDPNAPPQHWYTSTPIILIVMDVKEKEVSENKLLSEVACHSRNERQPGWRRYLNIFSGSMLTLMLISTILVEKYATRLEITEIHEKEEQLAENDNSGSLLKNIFSPSLWE